MRLLGGCIVVTELAVLAGASPPSAFVAAPAVASAGAVRDLVESGEAKGDLTSLDNPDAIDVVKAKLAEPR